MSLHKWLQQNCKCAQVKVWLQPLHVFHRIWVWWGPMWYLFHGALKHLLASLFVDTMLAFHYTCHFKCFISAFIYMCLCWTHHKKKKKIWLRSVSICFAFHVQISVSSIPVQIRVVTHSREIGNAKKCHKRNTLFCVFALLRSDPPKMKRPRLRTIAFEDYWLQLLPSTSDFFPIFDKKFYLQYKTPVPWHIGDASIYSMVGSPEREWSFNPDIVGVRKVTGIDISQLMDLIWPRCATCWKTN